LPTLKGPTKAIAMTPVLLIGPSIEKVAKFAQRFGLADHIITRLAQGCGITAGQGAVMVQFGRHFDSEQQIVKFRFM